jgi:2-polyprenyl-6-methoxyphenol hydroxylase-like FAD-dependent oxidoreductase
MDVPVLIVGGGPTGLCSSIMLSRLGIGSLLVEKHADTANHPKAVGITTRTMELFRQWGIEERVRAVSMSVDFVSSVRPALAGPEIQRMTLGYPDADLARTLSPTAPAACAQDFLEPILLAHARNHDHAELRFNTELTSIVQDERGVEATIVDRTTNRGRVVRARYVIAADGVWSSVRRKLGIEMSGDPRLGDHLSILFHDRLSVLFDAGATSLSSTARTPLCALYAVKNEHVSGILCPTSNDGRWIFATPWKSEDAIPDPCGLVELVRQATGVPDLDVELMDARMLTLGAQVAERFRDRNVFLVGDSAHRMTPSGGMGMNTAIHAAHNLAWKLAAVLHGWADPALLDSYEAERRPVGERNVARSIGEMPELTGLAADLGAVYASHAVLSDAGDEPLGYTKPGKPARVGQRVPHLWIERDGRHVSTLDLAERSMVLLVTSVGAAWCQPAMAAARALGVPLETCVVDARASMSSSDDLWHSYFGLDAACAVVLRPDGHIGWFTPASALDRTLLFVEALSSLTGRSVKAALPTTYVARQKRPSRQRTITTGEWRRPKRTSTKGS